MANERNPIDDIFRSGLKDSGITPPPGVWESVSAGLSPTVSNGVFTAIFKSMWTWVAVAGLGVTAVVINLPANKAVTADQPQIPAIAENQTQYPATEAAPKTASDKAVFNANQRGETVQPGDYTHPAESAAVSQVGSGTSVVSQSTAKQEENQSGGKPSGTESRRLVIEDHGMVSAAPCGRSLKVSAAVAVIDNSWTFSLDGAPAGAYCSWNFGDGEIGSGNPSHHVYADENAEYVVKAMVFRSANCMDSGICKVSVRQRHPGLSVPDVFTPNGDGINDELIITLPEVTQFNQIVTDRYGKQVFVSNNPLQRWNGKCASIDCMSGTYKVFITYKKPSAKSAVVFSKSILLNR